MFNSTATTATIVRLVNAMTYVFTVAAINAAGTGPPSAPTVPIANTDRAHSHLGHGEKRSSPRPLEPVLDRQRFRSRGLFGDYVLRRDRSDRHTFDPTVTTVTITGLTARHAHTFKVAAKT